MTNYLAIARSALPAEDLTIEQRLIECAARAVPEVTPAEVLELLSEGDREDIASGVIGLETVIAGALAYVSRRTREIGERPIGWDAKASCAQCGPVWLWTPINALACPWCSNRAVGLPIPRPEPVTCSDCRHFTRDGIGDGAGVGACEVGRRIEPGERPLYPDVDRTCALFHRLATPEYG